MSGFMSAAPCPDAFVALAGRLADTSGPIARRYFRHQITVEDKADLSPVTAADREIETTLRRLIAEAYPEHGIVGEEYGWERADTEYVWVLDPIDGTKRFVTGNRQFGTLIALLRGGRPILGVIDLPMLGERWLGADGLPTRHFDGGSETTAEVRPCAELARATLYATSPHMFVGQDAAAFAHVRDRVRFPLYGGECYAYGLLASGFVDLVIEADMGVYDFMAAVAVVTGAGGVITDWAGQPLGLTSDGRVLAAGDAGLHASALKLLHPRQARITKS